MTRKIQGGVHRLALQLIGILLFIGLDLGIKNLIHQFLQPVGSYVIFDKVFELSYVENTGAAWGVFSSNSTLLSLFVAVTLIILLFYMIFTKENRKLWHFSLAFVFAGGAANLIDRMIHGFVTDYIHVLFVDFPVFNLADCYIVVGCFLLIFLLLFDMVKEYREKKAEKNEKA